MKQFLIILTEKPQEKKKNKQKSTYKCMPRNKLSKRHDKTSKVKVISFIISCGWYNCKSVGDDERS
jgi:hypothetical protein